jgi:hypothetical protein
MQTYDQIIQILKDEKYNIIQDEHDEGYNSGLDYAIRVLKNLKKQENIFLEDINKIIVKDICEYAASMDDNYGIQ